MTKLGFASHKLVSALNWNPLPVAAISANEIECFKCSGNVLVH